MRTGRAPLPRSERIARTVVILAFVVMLAVGLCTFRDYNYSRDEAWERSTSIINYQFILEKLTGHELVVEDQALEDYPQRYYGVFFQLPMVVVEHVFHFGLNLDDVFAMRHLWNFLLCFSGWVCFYFFLKKVFGKRWLSLFGTLMLALYPRFWGGQFNNIKDMVFVATICWSMLCVAWCLERDERGGRGCWLSDMATAAVFAVCINTRVVGLMLPALLFSYRILRDVWLAPVAKAQGMAALMRRIGRYAAQLVAVIVLWILITPIAWVDVQRFIPNTLAMFSNYVQWQGEVPLLGHMYPGSALPWYYLPVWLGISLPLWYLALGLCSMPVMAVKAARSPEGFGKNLLTTNRFYLFALCVAALPIVAPIVKQTTLYNGWRHMYFILPAAVITMLYCFHALWQALCKRRVWQRVLAGAACLLLLGQVVWIARWHPLETVYFNPLGKQVATQVERDYWYESVYAQMRYVWQNDDAPVVNISCFNNTGEVYLCQLTPEEKARVNMVTERAENEDYVIDTFDTVPLYTPERFTKVRTFSVDGVPVSDLYIRTEYLNERFGGVWPGDGETK